MSDQTTKAIIYNTKAEESLNGFWYMLDLTGMLYLLSQIQRQGRGKAVAVFTSVSPEVCWPMVEDRILLSSLQAGVREMRW